MYSKYNIALQRIFKKHIVAIFAHYWTTPIIMLETIPAHRLSFNCMKSNLNLTIARKPFPLINSLFLKNCRHVETVYESLIVWRLVIILGRRQVVDDDDGASRMNLNYRNHLR